MSRWWKELWFLTSLVVGLWIAYLLLGGTLGPLLESIGVKDSIRDLGTTGDAFGILNSLFTGLALAAIVSAIFIQSEQLKVQVAQLKEQQREVNKTLRHLEQEDIWNRLKLQMEVLPQMSRRAELRLKVLLNGIYDIPDGLHESPVLISELIDSIKRLKEDQARYIDLTNSEIHKLDNERKPRFKEYDTMSDEERVERANAVYDSAGSSIKHRMQRLTEELAAHLQREKALDQANSTAHNIELYYIKLERAYREADSQAELGVKEHGDEK